MSKFYDLPREIIYEIYIRDGTYKVIYDKVIQVINKLPCFTRIEKNYYIFTRNVNKLFFDDYRISMNYSYKKSLIIIINKFTKPYTLIKN